ncbi:hypothetical protein HKD37_12G034160 [Glycine soja]
MTLKELLGILKVYEQELAQDEGTKKGQSLALTIQRPKRNSASKKLSSKALAINDALEKEFDDDDSDSEDDELSLTTRKIRKMWKNKNSSKFSGLSKRSFHKKEKSPIICYKCKKSEHFKSECLDHEKPKDKKNKFFKSKKKSLMSTWEDLDDSSSDEDSEKETNLCLMAYASTSKVELALDASLDDEDPLPNDIVNFDGEEHEDLKKAHQVHLVDFVLETKMPGSAQDAFVCEEFKAPLDEKVSSGCKNLLKDIQDLEETELPPEIVKIYKEIKTLRDRLGKFVGGHEALNKIIIVQRNPKDKYGHGFKGKKIVYGEEVIICYFYGKVGHETHKCKEFPEKGNP